MAAPPFQRAGAPRSRRRGGARLVSPGRLVGEEMGAWANQQRMYGKAFKKPASQRSKAEKKYAKNATKRRVALLDGIGLFTWVSS